MRTIIALLVAVVFLASCHEAGQMSPETAKIMSDTGRYTTIQWMDTVVNFDTITMGEQAKVVFRFHNIGNKPLVLAEVRAGCGCTAPDYTKGAIPPGGEGEVTGAFDSNKAHPGTVRKSIFVTANTFNGGTHTLVFTGVINEKK